MTLVDLFLSIHTKTSEAAFRRPALAAGINRLSTISRMADLGKNKPNKKKNTDVIIELQKKQFFVHFGSSFILLMVITNQMEILYQILKQQGLALAAFANNSNLFLK